MMDKVKELAQTPAFWQGAFVAAVVLLIAAHKLTLESIVGE